MARSQKQHVATPSAAWAAMERYRELPRDLRGGVLELQELREAHLWKHEKEADADYNWRVKALWLTPFYWSACDLLGGQPFTKAIGWSDDTPAVIGEWAKDIDGSGRDFRHVARSSCITSVGYGLNYLWPVWDPALGRPVIRILPGESVLDERESGAPIRVMMTELDRDEEKPWIKKEAEQVWIFYDGEPTSNSNEKYARWEVYEHEERYKADSPWNETPTADLGGYLDPLTKIPLVPLYTGNNPEDGVPWECYPPMHDLAVLNRVWINKTSDLDFGLHMANVPQRIAVGVDEETVKKMTKVSYKGLWWTNNAQAKFSFLEHSGSSFDLSLREIENIARKAEIMGHKPNIDRGDAAAAVTATGELARMAESVTTSQAWTFGWQDSWETAWRIAAQIGSQPDRFTLGFHANFGPRERDLDRARIIQADYQNGELEPEVYFPEAKRLGVYTEEFDAEAAAAAARQRRKDIEESLKANSLPPREGEDAEDENEDEEKDEDS